MSTATQQERTGNNGHDAAPLDAVLSETDRQMATRPELLQMRLENESIMAESRVRPRDFRKIKAELTAQLDAFPDLADKAIYEKPVGDGKTARGLSIRAAETIAEVYGYLRIRTDVTPIDRDHVKIEATFVDFQNGRLWQDGGIVSMLYKSKNGQQVRYSEDRFYGVVCKAEASRRVREVILRSVNSGLKEWFFTECERRLDAILDDGKVDEILKRFASKGATLQHLETFIGRPRTMGWTAEDRRKLIGVWNVIADGEANLDEVFGLTKPAASAPTADELEKKLKPVPQPVAALTKEEPDDEPKPDDWTQFLAAVKAAKTLADLTHCSDYWLAKERDFGAARNTEALAIVRERDAAIRAGKGKQAQGTLV